MSRSYALLYVLGALAFSAVAPIASYAVGLATAGIAHVVVEFRYVEERFGPRLGRRSLLVLAALLVAIAGSRLLGVAGVEGPLGRIELWLGLGLLVCILPLTWQRGGVAGLGGAFAAMFLAVGIVLAPLLTLVLLALLHNLTPVAFLAERLRGAERRQAMAWCALIFGGLPLLFLVGLPELLLGGLGWDRMAWSWPAAAPATDHLGVFVPAGLSEGWGMRLFAAAAFLQWMHYGAVLHVLPRLGPGAVGPSRVRWGTARSWRVPLAIVASLFLLLFLWRFGTARAVYGIFAAVHAWVELPLLLLALPGREPESVAT